MAGHEKPSNAKPATAEGDSGFLGRWSRRKAEARAGGEAVTPDEAPRSTDPASPREDRAAEQPGGEPTPDQPPEFDVSTLPDIDSLGPGSDFSMFMQAGVPPALKTRALRKLWRVKPELANLDGLLDYGEDLTGSFKVVDHLKTAYEVGRGFLEGRDPDATPEAPEDDLRPAEEPALADADASHAPESAELETAEPETSEQATSDQDAEAVGASSTLAPRTSEN